MTDFQSITFFTLFAGIVVGMCIGALGGMTFGGMLSYQDAMKQAYDRGHAVECLGKEGYYWECER